MLSGMSVAAIVLGPELGLFQRILHTVHLTFHQWLLCIVLGLAIIAVAEIRKWLLRRSGPEDAALGSEPEAVAA
jgi:Ca2+-transporting ATPase